MLNIHVARLKRLPQRSDETWQAALVRMPAWVPDPDGKPSRPWLGLCVSAGAGLVHSSKVRSPEQRSPGMVLEALGAFAADTKIGGYRPGRLEVRQPELATHLTEMLADISLQVAEVSELPALDEALEDLMRHFLQGRDDPAALKVDGVTTEHLRAFAEAAREFYESRPWRHLTDEDLIKVESPAAPRGFGFTTVMGAGGREYGLAFFESPRDLERMAELDNPQRIFAKRAVWSFTYGSIMDLPFGDVDAWEDFGLAVAGDEAYPLLACYEPKDRVRRPIPDEWAFVEGLARAVAQTTEPEMDSGRWTKSVQTINGSAEYVLALPALLEPTDDQRAKSSKARSGLPDRRVMERMLVDIQRATDGMEFASEEEYNRFLNENFRGEEVPHQPPRTSLERAQDLAYEAVEAQGRRRVQLARKSLEICPDCADAYVLLAEHRSDLHEARDFYAQGVAAGERVLGRRMFEEEAGNFWGMIETRPYMRARFGFAQCCEELEELSKAVGHYEELLRLNEHDNQGARYRLAICLLRVDNLDRLEALLRQHEDEIMALWKYIWALWAFRKEGDTPAARERAAAAHKANRHIRKYLLGDEELPDYMPEGYSLGDKSEAVTVAYELAELWQVTPGAVDWLAEQTRSTPRRPRRRRRK